MKDLPSRKEIEDTVRPFFFRQDGRIGTITDAFMSMLEHRELNAGRASKRPEDD